MAVWGLLWGAPGVPDGQSMPPWHGWSGLRKKMGVIGDFRVRGRVFKVKQFFTSNV